VSSAACRCDKTSNSSQPRPSHSIPNSTNTHASPKAAAAKTRPTPGPTSASSTAAGTPIKNIERWLIQRDALGNQSVPAEPVDRFPLPSEKRQNVTSVRDFDARRTDIENGQRGLLFALDPVFWPKPQPATIKVTYTDRAPARWRIQYTDAAGKQQQTESVENTGDGCRKTVTSRSRRLSAAGNFPNDPAFLAWRDEPPKQTGNAIANPDFRDGSNNWHVPEEYNIVADVDRNGSKLAEFTFRPGNDDTVHMDQLVPVEKGTVYRLTASIKNDGTHLKPGRSNRWHGLVNDRLSAVRKARRMGDAVRRIRSW
jgi:hypothetical protein